MKNRIKTFAVLAVLSFGCNQKSAEEGASGAHPEAEHGGGEEHHESNVVHLTPEAVQTIGLQVEPIARRPFGQGVTASGEIIADPDRTAIMGPRVSGRIAFVQGRLGDRVREGAVLAEVESPEVSHALGEMAAARAKLEAANFALERERALREKQIAPERTVLEAEANRAAAKADHEKAMAEVKALGLTESQAHELAKREAYRIPIRAPLSGVIIERQAIVGQTVEPKDTLFVVADLSHVMVDLQLPESVALSVQGGAPALLTPTANPALRLEGKVVYVSPVLTEGSRTVLARVRIENSDLKLKPRMFVTGRVQIAAAVSTLTVPVEAVQTMDGVPVVFVQEQPGEYAKRPVQLGARDSRMYAITGGLSEGDQVVTKGSFTLKGEASKDSIGGHED